MIQIFQVQTPREWLGRQQAAEYCNMSVRQFDRERRSEPLLLEPDGFSGKTPQWRPESLDLYLSRHRNDAPQLIHGAKSGRKLDARTQKWTQTGRK